MSAYIYLLYTLIHLYFCIPIKVSNSKINIKIAILMNSPMPVKGISIIADTVHLDNVRPVLEVALQKVRRTHQDYFNYSINVRNSFHRETTILSDSFAMKLQGCHVIFGPICGNCYTIASAYASFKRAIPVITTTGFKYDLKTEYTSVLAIRMYGNDRGAVNFGLNFLTLLNFSTMYVLHVFAPSTIYYGREFYKQSETWVGLGKLNHFTVYGKELLSKVDDHGTFINLNYTNDLLQIKLVSRVVVICAPPPTVRRIMLLARNLSYDQGDYLFVHVNLLKSVEELEKPWYSPKATAKENEEARKAFEALLIITVKQETDTDDYRKFSKEVRQQSIKMYGTDKHYGNKTISGYVGAYHDGVLLYAMAINETIAEGKNVTDGLTIASKMRNKKFKGITGTVDMEKGDRHMSYLLLDMNPFTGIFEVVGEYNSRSKKYAEKKGTAIHWPGKWTRPPYNEPKCGYKNDKCPHIEQRSSLVLPIILSSIILAILVITFYVYRFIKFQTSLRESNWKIKWEEIKLHNPKGKVMESSSVTLTQGQSATSVTSSDLEQRAIKQQLFTETAYFKGGLIALKRIKRSRFNLNRDALIEVKLRRDLLNDHICRFIGACIDAPNQCLLYEYCRKGSLQDVLENESLKMDGMFKISLIQDLIRAMEYLHKTDIKAHGNLKSSNCLVDSRFVIKLSNFGINFLREAEIHSDTFAHYHKKLWTCPEFLRTNHHRHSVHETQKADVYSFAIICQEILYRHGVFYIKDIHMEPIDTYKLVKWGQEPYWRPTMERYDLKDFCKPEIVHFVTKCWSENPEERPDFHTLRTHFRESSDGSHKGSFLDNLLTRMEQYANNLEVLVEQRTAAYMEHKKRAEDLLFMMLPKKIAEDLVAGNLVRAEAYEMVTIYFSDVVEFTKISAKCTPLQVVDMLDELFFMMDMVTENYDVYKVETIGDCYFVVSGLPTLNGNRHAAEIARMALEMRFRLEKYRIPHIPTDGLYMRFGIHTGPCCTAVIGNKMPQLHIIGDAVNTASRMESTSETMKIQITSVTKKFLDAVKTFDITDRGEVDVKGKGKMYTHWLNGEYKTVGSNVRRPFIDDKSYGKSSNTSTNRLTRGSKHKLSSKQMMPTPLSPKGIDAKTAKKTAAKVDNQLKKKAQQAAKESTTLNKKLPKSLSESSMLSFKGNLNKHPANSTWLAKLAQEKTKGRHTSTNSPTKVKLPVKEKQAPSESSELTPLKDRSNKHSAKLPLLTKFDEKNTNSATKKPPAIVKLPVKEKQMTSESLELSSLTETLSKPSDNLPLLTKFGNENPNTIAKKASDIDKSPTNETNMSDESSEYTSEKTSDQS